MSSLPTGLFLSGFLTKNPLSIRLLSLECHMSCTFHPH
jgi:hypothetical protein